MWRSTEDDQLVVETYCSKVQHTLKKLNQQVFKIIIKNMQFDQWLRYKFLTTDKNI